MLPKWGQRNLRTHYRKHPAGKDRECWQDLLGKDDEPVSEAEYEDESIDVCSRAWLEYIAEEVDKDAVGPARRQGLDVPYHPRRRYHVDERLLITITSPDGGDVVTCFHEHFDMRHVPLVDQAPVGELQDRYRKKIEVRESSKMMRNLERLHDGS